MKVAHPDRHQAAGPEVLAKIHEVVVTINHAFGEYENRIKWAKDGRIPYPDQTHLPVMWQELSEDFQKYLFTHFRFLNNPAARAALCTSEGFASARLRSAAR